MTCDPGYTVLGEQGGRSLCLASLYGSRPASRLKASSLRLQRGLEKSKYLSSFFWNLLPPTHTHPTCPWMLPPPLGGALSYTTPFPTGQNLKEDQLGLEQGHSHFQPNLQYVDPNTEVTQLRASSLWGFSLSYSWVFPAPSPACRSSQPLLHFICLSLPQLNFQRPEVVKSAAP